MSFACSMQGERGKSYWSLVLIRCLVVPCLCRAASVTFGAENAGVGSNVISKQTIGSAGQQVRIHAPSIF